MFVVANHVCCCCCCWHDELHTSFDIENAYKLPMESGDKAEDRSCKTIIAEMGK